MTGQSRKGDNLFTCSIVALNVETGKMVWYFQVSPHDTHDWDAVQTPVLIDGEFNGKPRKMLAQASRNGYFFLLDRTNGQEPADHADHRYDELVKGRRCQGPADSESRKGADDRRRAGVAEFRRRDQLACRRASTRKPDCSMSAPIETFSDVLSDRHRSASRKATARPNAMPVATAARLRAIDYKTGKTAWNHRLSGRRRRRPAF